MTSIKQLLFKWLLSVIGTEELSASLGGQWYFNLSRGVLWARFNKLSSARHLIRIRKSFTSELLKLSKSFKPEIINIFKIWFGYLENISSVRLLRNMIVKRKLTSVIPSLLSLYNCDYIKNTKMCFIKTYLVN